MSARDNTAAEVESNASFLDKDGNLLAVRSITLVPERSFGDLRLYSSAVAELLLAKATTLETEDGVRFRLSNLRLSAASHTETNPEFRHLEFYFEPLAAAGEIAGQS